MKKILALLVLGVSAVSLNANALDASVVGGVTFSNPSSTPDLGTSAKAALTFGALLGFNDMGMVGFETGLLSVGKKRSATVLGVEATTSSRAWELPLLVRFNLLPVFSFGAGGYIQKATGKITTEAAGLKVETDYTGYKTTDFGLKLNARAGMPIAPATSLFLDASYKRGLVNLIENPVGDESLKNNEIDLLAGVNFGF